MQEDDFEAEERPPLPGTRFFLGQWSIARNLLLIGLLWATTFAAYWILTRVQRLLPQEEMVTLESFSV